MVKMRTEGTIKEMPEDFDFPPILPMEQEDLTFLDVLLIITQRKKLVGLITAVCTALGLILAFALPQEYTATVIILPPQGNSSMSSMLAGQLSGMNSAMGGVAGSMLGMKNINDMYVSMLKSRSVEDAVIQRYELQSEYKKKYLADTRKALEKHTKIDGSTKDGLIRLNFMTAILTAPQKLQTDTWINSEIYRSIWRLPKHRSDAWFSRVNWKKPRQIWKTPTKH